jgi:hypothetical protein
VLAPNGQVKKVVVNLHNMCSAYIEDCQSRSRLVVHLDYVENYMSHSS